MTAYHAPLNRDDGGLLPKRLFTSRQRKGQVIRERVKDLLLQRLDHT